MARVPPRKIEMRSKAITVDQYLADLPADRRESLQAVRQVILKNLDGGFEEGMQYGIIGYYVPHRVYPAGYHCDPKQPLPFAALASQKNYMTLHLMTIYGDTRQRASFEQAWAKSGKKLDAGKGCIRFKRLDDIPLDVIGEAIRRVTAKKHIEMYEWAMEENAERASERAEARKLKSSTGIGTSARKRAR
jgi:hypothetical protein